MATGSQGSLYRWVSNRTRVFNLAYYVEGGATVESGTVVVVLVVEVVVVGGWVVEVTTGTEVAGLVG